VRFKADARGRTALAALVALITALAPAAADAAPRRKAPRLRAFSSCPALVDYARTNAERFGGGTGVPARALPPQPQVLTAPPPRASAGPTVVPQQGATPSPTPPAASPGADRRR